MEADEEDGWPTPCDDLFLSVSASIHEIRGRFQGREWIR